VAAITNPFKRLRRPVTSVARGFIIQVFSFLLLNFHTELMFNYEDRIWYGKTIFWINVGSTNQVTNIDKQFIGKMAVVFEVLKHCLFDIRIYT
jgi:hypothetical protein